MYKEEIQLPCSVVRDTQKVILMAVGDRRGNSFTVEAGPPRLPKNELCTLDYDRQFKHAICSI